MLAYYDDDKKSECDLLTFTSALNAPEQDNGNLNSRITQFGTNSYTTQYLNFVLIFLLTPTTTSSSILMHQNNCTSSLNYHEAMAVPQPAPTRFAPAEQS